MVEDSAGVCRIALGIWAVVSTVQTIVASQLLCVTMYCKAHLHERYLHVPFCGWGVGSSV